MRQGIETIKVNQLPTVVTEPEALRIPVEATKSILYTVEVPSLLAREEEHLLSLHRICSQIGNVVRIGGDRKSTRLNSSHVARSYPVRRSREHRPRGSEHWH